MIRIKAHKENGQIRSVRSLREEMASLPDGVYEVKVSEWKNKRSLDQNNLYWQWLTVIGDELGYWKEELHEEFIEAFSEMYTIKGLDGKPKQKRMRTSTMDTKQMSRYMERIDQFAAEQGIILPQPEEELTPVP